MPMSDTLRVLLALLDIALDVKGLLGAQWPLFRDELLTLSGRLDRPEEATAVGRDLDALLEWLLSEAPPDAQTLVRRALLEAAPEDGYESVTRGGVAQPAAGSSSAPPQPDMSDLEGVVVIPLFYGTDRARGTGDEPKNYYAGKRGSLALGVAHVSVPTQGRAVGDLTTPAWWRLEFKQDRSKHVVLIDVRSRERSAFVAELRDSLTLADERDVLIFIHGYNTSFEDAARRAAQISVDLRFSGRTLLYSWASAAEAKSYTVDEDTIDWSRQYFDEFLRLALTEIGARDVHVIAHSMGNRALMNTIERLDMTNAKPGAATLCQLIFAAPDVGRDRFVQLAEAFKGRAQRCTLYASSRDVALRASKVVHGYPRAGDAGASLVVVDGVDTIDASEVDTSLIGLRHSYFGSARSILGDIAALLAHRLAPDKRFEIQPAGNAARRYWSYRP